MKRPYEMDALNTNPRSYIYRICECDYHKKKLVEMYPLIEFYIYSKLSKKHDISDFAVCQNKHVPKAKRYLYTERTKSTASNFTPQNKKKNKQKHQITKKYNKTKALTKIFSRPKKNNHQFQMKK